ncbi:uncharacterized protein LOC128227231 [Mya arenaria]|uniref:uncharacterized protein LOC128227231 n=1 Tax=Mya arenaria TaxID=6604 RepID=UPI0022E35A4B|nr:uncharacterized protein LOC128227231 [Mya arenaria]XP_052793500.1 uncharacterized protein LOC128227231 [Mya arenaria]
MDSVLFSFIIMSVLRDSTETATEFDVIAMLKDTDQLPLVTGSNHWSDWKPDKIIDGIYGGGKATACTCCAALKTPAWANLDLTSPFLISRFEVFGRTDDEKVGEQFHNITVSTGRTDLEVLYAGYILSNTTYLIAKPFPPLFLQDLTVSSPSSVLTICEMHLFAYRFGAIISGNARQSETYMQCTADKALDGKRIFSETTSSCTCSVTKNSNKNAFWEIDLSTQHLIEHIVVTGRRGRDILSG